MKKLFIVILLSFLVVSCWTNKNQQLQPQVEPTNVSVSEPVQEKLLVTSSIIPLSSAVEAIGGDYVDVNNIIPAWVSPHGFDMSAKQRAIVEDAEIVFFTGLDHIDGFLEKSVPENLQVHLADWIELIEIEEHEHHDDHEDEHKEDDHHDDEHEDHHDDNNHKDEHDHVEEDDHEDDEEHDDHHDDHSSDPHVWLGKDNIIAIAKKIEMELSEKLPEQATYFTENRQKFENDLNAIYEDFSLKIQGKTPQEFIIFHDAYNYLFESIGLDRNLKIPFSENILHDTGTAHMAELIDEIKLHNIKHIFREPQFSDSNLQKFVDEYDLQIGTLDPLWTDVSSEGYLKNIQNNLDTLINIYE